jgi:hypothetical protein
MIEIKNHDDIYVLNFLQATLGGLISQNYNIIDFDTTGNMHALDL